MNTDNSPSIMKYKFLHTLFLLFMVSCYLPGCEKSRQNTALVKEEIKKYEQATTLHGVVSNNEGPIKAGTIKVTDSIDELVASTSLENNGHYSVEIPANTFLPIVLTFYPETADGQKLMTAVVHTSITKYDINPLTTSIARKALAMGGYNHANMVRAAEGTVKVPDANKTTAGFHGDPTTQYGGWH
jgi:hypothetical protein